jgi:hypothetical protein
MMNVMTGRALQWSTTMNSKILTIPNQKVPLEHSLLFFGKQKWRDLITNNPGENHRPVASHWQTLSHKNVMLYTLSWSRFELTTSVVIGTDCIGSCKSNYHTIMATTAPQVNTRLDIKYIKILLYKLIFYNIK